MKKTLLKIGGIMAICTMIFVNTHFMFDQNPETDTNLAFIEQNLEAYAEATREDCSYSPGMKFLDGWLCVSYGLTCPGITCPG